jgi:hypothetical protein
MRLEERIKAEIQGRQEEAKRLNIYGKARTIYEAYHKLDARIPNIGVSIEQVSHQEGEQYQVYSAHKLVFEGDTFEGKVRVTAYKPQESLRHHMGGYAQWYDAFLEMHQIAAQALREYKNRTPQQERRVKLEKAAREKWNIDTTKKPVRRG